MIIKVTKGTRGESRWLGDLSATQVTRYRWRINTPFGQVRPMSACGLEPRYPLFVKSVGQFLLVCLDALSITSYTSIVNRNGGEPVV